MGKITQETGNRYGRLTVLSFSHIDKHGKARWLCKCDCGNEVVVVGGNLHNNTKSCGCIHKEQLLARNVKGEKHPMWGKTGEKSARWKGGVRIHQGYTMIFNREYLKQSANGYVGEHILVMEKMFGGPLPEGSVVHHCNADRSDNRPYNLRLFLSQAEHTAYHQKLRRERASANR